MKFVKAMKGCKSMIEYMPFAIVSRGISATQPIGIAAEIKARLQGVLGMSGRNWMKRFRRETGKGGSERNLFLRWL